MENLKLIRDLSSIAVKALLYEVSATPKPGLVDRNNQGAHKDMDFFTFVDSATALTDYFYNVSLAGYSHEDSDLMKLFKKIRPLGMAAEKAMFQATGNINTHKGLIFSLGIVFCAAGYLLKTAQKLSASELSATAKAMLQGITLNDFKLLHKKTSLTNGEKLYLAYGVKGIRGEAEQGFKTVLDTTYPALCENMAKGSNLNDAGVGSLLKTMAVLDDTNILSRHDFDTLLYVKNCAAQGIDYGLMNTEKGRNYLWELDQQFIIKNVSPGGSADLLAIAYAFYFLERCHQ